MDSGDWFEEQWKPLEEAYLSTGDPRGQSGFRGAAERWERARRVIAEAVDRDGTFLDIGCANGLLMESIVKWTRAAGYEVEPYGVDLSPKLAALARRRLPAWSQNIWTANAATWRPPRRFDFVRTELEYVPERDRRGYLEHLLDFLLPDGKLIVCWYRGSDRPLEGSPRPRDVLSSWGQVPLEEAEARDVDGTLLTRVAWIEAPHGNRS